MLRAGVKYILVHPVLAMNSTDSSLLDAILSDDNDTRNKAEVSTHDDLVPMR